jgi:trk system potassium uptake protein TrkH
MKVYLPVIRVLSMVIFIFGLTMLVPVGVSWVFQDGAARAFDEAILLTLGVGLVLWGFTRRNKRDLTIA